MGNGAGLGNVAGMGDVALVDIDPRSEPDPTFPGAYGVYLILSRDPGPVWASEFERQWKQAPHGVKRRMTVVGDRLRVTIGARDHVQEILSVAADLVAKTNAAVRWREEGPAHREGEDRERGN